MMVSVFNFITDNDRPHLFFGKAFFFSLAIFCRASTKDKQQRILSTIMSAPTSPLPETAVATQHLPFISLANDVKKEIAGAVFEKHVGLLCGILQVSNITDEELRTTVTTAWAKTPKETSSHALTLDTAWLNDLRKYLQVLLGLQPVFVADLATSLAAYGFCGWIFSLVTRALKESNGFEKGLTEEEHDTGAQVLEQALKHPRIYQDWQALKSSSIPGLEDDDSPLFCFLIKQWARNKVCNIKDAMYQGWPVVDISFGDGKKKEQDGHSSSSSTSTSSTFTSVATPTRNMSSKEEAEVSIIAEIVMKTHSKVSLLAEDGAQRIIHKTNPGQLKKIVESLRGLDVESKKKSAVGTKDDECKDKMSTVKESGPSEPLSKLRKNAQGSKKVLKSAHANLCELYATCLQPMVDDMIAPNVRGFEPYLHLLFDNVIRIQGNDQESPFYNVSFAHQQSFVSTCQILFPTIRKSTGAFFALLFRELSHCAHQKGMLLPAVKQGLFQPPSIGGQENEPNNMPSPDKASSSAKGGRGGSLRTNKNPKKQRNKERSKEKREKQRKAAEDYGASNNASLPLHLLPAKPASSS